MKITIINSERYEKRYTRVELEEFVAQLRDGTYRRQYISDFNKDVCIIHRHHQQPPSAGGSYGLAPLHLRLFR